MTSDSRTPFQIIISGFHRSGTSLTAQYLHRAGLNLGHNLMAANPSNPDGHFEDRDIVTLHNDMLKANGREWFTPGTDLSNCVEGFDKRAKSLLARFPKDRDVGFKDPRSSLFLPWWHKLLEKPRTVIIFRHYASCYHSLQNRQAQNLCFDPSRHSDALFFWQHPELALQLWLDYNRAIIDYVKTHQDSTLLVSHHSLLQGLNLPAALNRKFDTDLNTDCDSGIRPGNRGIHGISESIGVELRKKLEAILTTLNNLCSTEREPQAMLPLPPRSLSASIMLEQQRQSIEAQCNRLQLPVAEKARLIEEKSAAINTRNTVNDLPENIGNANQSDDVKQLIHWGKQHQLTQNPVSAEACWLKAHQLAPRNYPALLQLALLARDQGQHEKTVEFMQAGIQVKPDDAGSRVHLARALIQTGSTEQALCVVQDGLNLQAEHLQLHLLHIELLQATAQQEEAMCACTKALALFPDNYQLVRTMVKLTGEIGDSAASMNWFRRSVLVRMRHKLNYREALFQVLDQIPVDCQMRLSERVLAELVQMDT